MERSHFIEIDKAVATRLSAYGLILVFIGSGIFQEVTTSRVDIGNSGPLMLLVAVATIIIHEFVHGLGFQILGGRVKYGVGVKYWLLPYAYATSPGSAYSLGQSLFVGLAPFIALSLIFAGLALVLPSLGAYLAVAFLTNFGGAVGDLWLAHNLLRFRRLSGVRVVDHGDSVEVVTDDSRLLSITAATKQKAQRTSFLTQWLGAALSLFLLTALVPGLLRVFKFPRPVHIGMKGFYLVQYQPDAHGLTVTLQLLPILLGGLIFAIFFRLMRR